ncbi:hypothetical protein QTP88_010536 [Uroleucon formosanum]
MIDTHLNIIQWNLNGFSKKREEIGFLIQEYNPEIICLQETNFKENYVAPIKNYNGYSKNRQGADRASGGIAIYIKSYILNTTINIQSEIEVLAVQVNLKEKLTICNIYLPNQKKFSSSDIDQIIQQLPTPYIIFGDFNAHSSLWGSAKTDPSGKEIEKLLEKVNIVLPNDVSPTHINIANGNLCCIDLTLCPSSLAHRLEWKVLPHLLSKNFIELKKIRAKSKFLIKNSKKESWKKFTCSINNKTNLKELWTKIRSLKGLNRDQEIHITDEHTSTSLPEEVAQKIGSFFYENFSNSIYKQKFIDEIKIPAENTPIQFDTSLIDSDQISLNATITLKEMNLALSKCKSKSPGPVEIPYCFLQNLGSSAKNYLLNLYNTIWRTGRIPDEWKKGIIIPIHKPGKDKHSVEGYRPITLHDKSNGKNNKQ